MLNQILFALTLSLFSANTFAAIVMTCSQMEIYQQNQTGQGSFQPHPVAIEISDSSAGKFGYVAKLTANNRPEYEKDVQVEVAAPQAMDQLKEITALILPQINWTDVVKVRTGNVGVTVNRTDSAGILIFELIDAGNVVLGKVTQVGWSFGRCY